MQLTLSAAVTVGQVVTAAYTQNSGQPGQNIKDAGGAAVATTGVAIAVSNLVGLSPTLASAVVRNAAPTVVEVTFSADITAGTPTAADFEVKVANTIKTTTPALSNGKVTLTLASPVTVGQQVTVAYTKDGAQAGQNINDGASSTVETLGATAVSNLVGVAPTLTSGVVTNAAPTVIMLTFSADITAGTPVLEVRVASTVATVSSFTVNSGSDGKVRLTLAAAVTSLQAVTVAYRKASTVSASCSGCALQDLVAAPGCFPGANSFPSSAASQLTISGLPSGKHFVFR